MRPDGSNRPTDYLCRRHRDRRCRRRFRELHLLSIAGAHSAKRVGAPRGAGTTGESRACRTRTSTREGGRGCGDPRSRAGGVVERSRAHHVRGQSENVERCAPLAISLFREQFYRALPVLAGEEQRLQMVASTYVRGMVFERHINGLRAFEGRMEISPENVKEALD